MHSLTLSRFEVLTKNSLYHKNTILKILKFNKKKRFSFLITASFSDVFCFNQDSPSQPFNMFSFKLCISQYGSSKLGCWPRLMPSID